MSTVSAHRIAAGSPVPQPRSILIVGCGIAGPAIATLVLSSPLPAAQLPHITIIERSPQFLGSGQNIDIRGIGKHVIRLLGLENAIKRSTTGEEGVKLVDEKGGVWAQFAANKSGKVETPTSDVEVLRGKLAAILFGKAKEVSDNVQARNGLGVEFIFNESITSLHDTGDRVDVSLAKAGNRTYDLVVGADGLNSKTRKLAFGSLAAGCLKPLEMYGAFFSMSKEKQDGKWRSWFHCPGGRSVMLRPSGTNEMNTVLVLLADKSEEIRKEVQAMGRDVDAQKTLVMRKMQGMGWQEDRLIDAVEESKDFYFDELAQIKLERWSTGRVVLLGDAGFVFPASFPYFFFQKFADRKQVLRLAILRNGNNTRTRRRIPSSWLSTQQPYLP